MDYYEERELELKRLRDEGSEKKKKNITYIENDAHRRVTYHKRAKNMKLLAMELEVQTRCFVDVTASPNWKNGATHSYKTSKGGTVATDQPFSEADKENEPVSTSSVTCTAIPEPDVLPGSSGDNRPHPVVRIVPVIPQKNKKAACRMCGDVEETTFFVGCGHKNPKTHRQDCNYWVHQGCIGIHYKRKEDLENLPYFCQKHYPKKRNIKKK